MKVDFVSSPIPGSLVKFSLYIFYCHKLQQWGWVTSSRNISYDTLPTYTDQSKHENMGTKLA